MSSSNASQSIPLAPALKPVLSDRYVATWSDVLMVAAYALMFLFLSHLPLAPTVTWLNVAEGNAILDTGSVSSMRSLFPLTEGMYHQPLGWLSQVLMAALERWGGTAALGGLLTLAPLMTLMFIGMAVHRVTGHKSLVLIAVTWSFYMSWPQLSVLRTTMLGAMCASLMVWLLSHTSVWESRRTHSRSRGSIALLRWSVPALIVLWANLDGSVTIGLATVFAFLVGQVVDHLRGHSWRTLLANSQVRSWLLITEMCCVATLLQPAGWALWTDLIQGDLGLLGQTTEIQQPMLLLTWSGVGFIGCWLTSMLLFRLSRRRVRTVEVLLLLGGSAVLMGNIQLSIIVVPMLVMSLVRHATDIHRQWSTELPSKLMRRQPKASPQSMEFAQSLICLLLIWIAFALSPLSQPLLGGADRSPEQVYGQNTPIALASELRKQPGGEMTWAPAVWGDWLAWQLGPDAELFTGSQIGRLPQQARRDYAAVHRGDYGWEDILDRYGVENLVIDKLSQQGLLKRARNRDSEWKPIYEDQQSFVFRRKVADRFANSEPEFGAVASW